MKKELFNLSGKTALVTGANRGIGLAIAQELAQDGANIAITARNKQQLENAKNKIESNTNQKVHTFSFDLENTEQIPSLFKDIISRTKQLNILVNCAGINKRSAAEDVETETWEQVIKVNLTAVFLLSQQFCQHRKKLGQGGKIINIGSLQCKAARPTTTAYAASKGGIAMLTKSLAVEWAKYKINVNAIGPGYIATDLTAKLKADEDFNKWVISKTPLERWGLPEDIAGTAVFLASSASDFVTGQIVYVDGGWLAAL